jgi:hypothetical protein
LQITTQQQTGDATRRPFKLICPKRQPHVQYYGYEVSDAWLIQLVESYWPEVLPDRNVKHYEDTAMTRGFELVRHWTGIYNLDGQDCFNPKGGYVPPEWFALFDDDDEDEEFEDIDIDIVHVFVLCSDQEESFKERPTQEDVDYMTKLMGHVPQWWVGCRIGDD